MVRQPLLVTSAVTDTSTMGADRSFTSVFGRTRGDSFVTGRTVSAVSARSSPSPTVCMSGALGVAQVGASGQFVVPTECGDVLGVGKTIVEEGGGRRGSHFRLSPQQGVDGFTVCKGHVGPATSVHAHPLIPG